MLFHSGDDVYEADDMSVLDTLHNRHQVEDIRENIVKFKEWQARQNNRETSLDSDLQ